MSKAEDLAKEFLKKLVSHTTLYKNTIDELEVYEPDDVIWAYKEGYRQAQIDNELTWEDIRDICRMWIESKTPFGVTGEALSIEVLNRFNKQKGK